MKNIITIIAITFLVCMPAAEIAYAQCPMCKMSAESNMKNGGTAGKGLNKGIFLILGTPYLLVGTLGYIWWKNKKKNAEKDFELN